jgi:hypothetical protein
MAAVELLALARPQQGQQWKARRNGVLGADGPAPAAGIELLALAGYRGDKANSSVGRAGGCPHFLSRGFQLFSFGRPAQETRERLKVVTDDDLFLELPQYLFATFPPHLTAL